MTDETVSGTATPAEKGDAAQAVEKEVSEVVTDEGQEADPDAAAKPAKELTDAERAAKADKKLAKTEFEKRAIRRELRVKSEMLEQLLAMHQPSKQAQVQDKEPDINDFDSLPKYIRAFNAWERAQEQQSQQSKAPERAPESDGGPDWGRVVMSTEYRSHRDDLMEVGSEKYTDFEDVVTAVDARYMNPDVALTLFQIPDEGLRADVTYYLSKNQKEIQKFASMTPIQRAIEVGRIESKLHSSPGSAKRPSSAPAPINPVSGSRTAKEEIRPGMKYEDFIRVRNKQLRR